MGWVNQDHPSHEGYVVGLVPVEPPSVRCRRRPRANPHDCQRQCPSDRLHFPCLPREGDPLTDAWETWMRREKWRELGMFDNDSKPIERVHRIQIGCSCGWRSPVFHAPLGTKYYPHTTDVPEFAEDDLLTVWRHHLTAPTLQRLHMAEVI